MRLIGAFAACLPHTIRQIMSEIPRKVRSQQSRVSGSLLRVRTVSRHGVCCVRARACEQIVKGCAAARSSRSRQIVQNLPPCHTAVRLFASN